MFDARRTSTGTIVLMSSRRGGGSATKAIDCVPTMFKYCLTRCMVHGLWDHVVRLRKVAGDFNTLRILGKVSLRVKGNRIIDVINPDKTKGAALLRVVNALSGPSKKQVVLGNARMGHLGRGRLSTFQGQRVNFIFRFRRLLPRFATLRGIVVPSLVRNGSTKATQGRTLSLLSFLKLSRQTARGPTRLSNNRGRHITMTHTLVGRPSMVLTSRPSKDLSARGGKRLRQLFFRLHSGLKRAFIVIARSRRLTARASHAVRLMSKHVMWCWGGPIPMYMPTSKVVFSSVCRSF